MSRRENAEKAVGVAGGKVLGYYACGDAEWDLVNLFESPDEWGAAGAAKTIATLTGTGAFSHIRLHPLVTAEAYDGVDIQATTQAYRAPGQS